MARELLLKGGYVVTVDDVVGDVEGGDVLIRGDRIAAVGPNLPAQNQNTEVIDVTGRVVPGLVYNKERIKISLGSRSPMEYRANLGYAT
jgi:imidazolonepropionase-like amidohydrolase